MLSSHKSKRGSSLFDRLSWATAERIDLINNIEMPLRYYYSWISRVLIDLFIKIINFVLFKI